MFRKTTKRILSLVLAMLLIMSCGIFSFAAVQETGDLETARGKFRTAEGPVTGSSLLSKGYRTDYSYSSPLDTDYNSTKKYPVVFFIGQTTTAGHQGAELRETSFPLWSMPAYQSRFYNASGAFIVLARTHPLESYFGSIANESYVRESIKAMMDDFIAKNKDHVDTDRIYLVSWDEGCRLAINIAADYPTYFAAMVLCSPAGLTINSGLEDKFSALADVPVWLMVCKADPKSAFSEYGTKLWNVIKNTTAHSYVCRYTTFDTFNVSTAGETAHHSTWEYAAYDCRYSGEFSGAKTIDGPERSYTFDSKSSDGVIDWLSKIGSDYGSDCTCKCHHATGWARFLWNLKMLISMMLKIKWNRECACGQIHY